MSEKCIDEACAFSIQTGYISYIIDCYNVIALLALGKLNIDKANNFSTKAIKLAEENQLKIHLIRCNDVLDRIIKTKAFERTFETVKEKTEIEAH